MVAETADGASLTDVKQALVDHVTSGKLLDFAAAKSVDEAAMRTWDSTRTVQAAVLRDILLGRLAPNLDPHGLQLRGARITGQLDLENLTISVWVQLYDCLLDEGLVAHDATLPGLVLSGCRFEHSSQPPLAADRLTAAVLLLDRAVITAASETGAIRLRSAHLGLLDCTDATIRNRTGPALAAEGLEVDQDVFLRGRFKAVGGGEGGAVRLAAAHVGELICTGARMRNGTGSALDAWGLQVDRNIFLDGFKAIGAGADGAVRLAAAHVHGLLDCTGATMRNKAGPALMAEAFQVDQSIVLREFTAVGGGDVTLHLALAQIGGALVFAPARLEHTADPQGRLVLDGLTYAGLPREISSREWLRLLREGTPSYAAQPYQQFAGAQRAAGDDGEVRKVLMAQRKDQIDRGALSGRADRAWARLTGLTLGYGYRPWRALLALVAIATIAVVLALILGTHGGVAHTDRRPPVGSRCSVVERIGVGLDLGLPLIKTGVRDHCDTTATATGQILTVAGWGLQLLAWAFATLFVAGFTGIVRKT